jgi:spore coat protein H
MSGIHRDRAFMFYVFEVAVLMLLRDTSIVVMDRIARSSFVAGSLRVFLFTFAMTLDSDAWAAEAAKKSPGDKFFNEPEIRTFNFEISEAASNQLRRSPRSYVTGSVREGQHVLTNVAIRLKGMGSFRTIDDKPSLAVKFDEFATNQHYRGLSKLMFNNSVQDSTYLAELLATQLFRDAGVPAARYTHARVRLNGRDLGLYVIAEAMNKQFLKQHFRNGNGNLYEAYLGDIDSRMEQDGGKDTSMSDVRKLYAACKISDPSERWREVNKMLDVDRFLSFVAMEMLTSHWDGYAIHTNNYRIYHDPTTDKFVFITHGIDWAFKRTNVLIQPPMKSIVGRAVLSTPEGHKLYTDRVGTLFTNVFKVSVITNRLEQALTRIRRADLPADELARIERRDRLLQRRIELRAENVAGQLAGIPPVPLKFGANGVATLNTTNYWRDEPDRGEPLIDLVQLDRKDTLHIQARNERTRASWRAQVYLTRGWYRFEGMTRTALATSGSARLRISGDTRSIGISGSSPAWRPLAHVFEVQDDGMDVELVCELTTLQGEVWFDVSSFQLRKLSAAEARQLSTPRSFGE